MNRIDNCVDSDSRGFEISPLSGSCSVSMESGTKESLDSVVLDGMDDLFDKKTILKDSLKRIGLIIGSVSALYAATEIVRHYHLADYLR